MTDDKRAGELLKALKKIASIGEGFPENIHESQVRRYSSKAIQIAVEAIAKVEGGEA